MCNMYKCKFQHSFSNMKGWVQNHAKWRLEWKKNHGEKSWILACGLQNSRIFCECGRPSICERKAAWSECENGKGEWGETLKNTTSRALWACEARALHKRASRLRRFAPSETSEKDCFAVYFRCQVGFLFHAVLVVFSKIDLASNGENKLKEENGTYFNLLKCSQRLSR